MEVTMNFKPRRKSYRLTKDKLDDLNVKFAYEAGALDWEFTYKIYPGAENAIAKTINIEVKYNIKMPVWTKYSQQSKEIKARWDKFYKALHQHEKKHEEILRNGFLRIKTQLKLMNNSTGQATKEWIEKEVNKIQDQQDDFDRKTDHGKKEGVIL